MFSCVPFSPIFPWVQVEFKGNAKLMPSRWYLVEKITIWNRCGEPKCWPLFTITTMLSNATAKVWWQKTLARFWIAGVARIAIKVAVCTVRGRERKLQCKFLPQNIFLGYCLLLWTTIWSNIFIPSSHLKFLSSTLLSHLKWKMLLALGWAFHRAILK